MDVASRLGRRSPCWADEGKCRVTRQSVGGGKVDGVKVLHYIV